MKRPFTLSLSVFLNWIVALLGAFGGLLFLAGGWAMFEPSTQQQVEAALTQENIVLPEGVTTQTIAVGVLSVGLIALLLAVIRIVITVSLAKGHRWARGVLTLLALIAMITGGLEIWQGQPLLWRGVAVVVLEVFVLWLMWNGKSSAYFAHRTGQRAVARAVAKG